MEWIVIGLLLWGAVSVVNSLSNRPSSHIPLSTPSYTTPRRTRRRINEKQIDLSQIELGDEQRRLFEHVEQSRNHIFVTGKAGTGKSVLLQWLKQNSRKNVVVAAPTGVAALNVGGQTIHSLFGIPPRFIEKDGLRIGSRAATLFRHVDTVVLDEASMIRADLMDAIDSLLRQARRSNDPFGGVQLVMFGDVYQLPPVVADEELHKYFADNHGGYHFFHAHVWKETPLEIFELKTVYRQQDKEFIEILNAIRTGHIQNEVLDRLNSRAGETPPDEGFLTLATTNRAVEAINSTRLARLPAREYVYRAIISGELEKSAFPTEECLRLKAGAQVMFLKNDREKRWVNGTIGVVKSLTNNTVRVDVDGVVHTVPQETWSKIRYYYDQETQSVEAEPISSFTQFPLRLAWAVTIHKAQGQTYNQVMIDMGDGAFAHGQTYVALSRCRTLEGIYLKRPLASEDVMVDPHVIEFMRRSKIIAAKQIEEVPT